MVVLMEAGPDQIDALTDSYRNCDGAAASMAQTMMDNLGGDLEELGGSIETLAISVGEIMVRSSGRSWQSCRSLWIN